LIPPTPPTIPHLDIAAVYRPAGDGAEVGGDFYDVFQIADGDWVVVIGDVRGKGVEAAAITAFVRHTLRAAAVMSADPAVALSRLNAALLHHSTDRFCTVAFLRLSQLDGGWRGSVCAAGHPLPLLRRDGVVSFLGSPGSLLGVFEEPVLVEEPVELQPRDVVVLYTDGIPDGRRDGEFYGDERLLTAVRDGADEAHALADEVAQDAISFQRGVTRDDIAVVVARVPA
jgi:sigma-B regulation protein RsbU (phosphoserine phosphatase)